METKINICIHGAVKARTNARCFICGVQIQFLRLSLQNRLQTKYINFHTSWCHTGELFFNCLLSLQVGRHPVKPTTTTNGGAAAPPAVQPRLAERTARHRGSNLGDVSSPEAGRKSSLGGLCSGGGGTSAAGHNFSAAVGPFTGAAGLLPSTRQAAQQLQQQPPPQPLQRPSRLPIVSVYNPKLAALTTMLDLKPTTTTGRPQPVSQAGGVLPLPRKALTASPEPQMSPKMDRHPAAPTLVNQLAAGGGMAGAGPMKRGTPPASCTSPQQWPMAVVGGGLGRRPMSPKRGDISRRMASPTFPTRRRSPSLTRSVSV